MKHLGFFSECFTELFHSILDSFFGLLCFRFRLTGVSSIILFRARILRHGVLANSLVECFSFVVPNMVLSKLNIPKLVSQHTRGRYTFQPLWVSGRTEWKSCFQMSLTPSSSSRDRNKIWRNMELVDQPLQGILSAISLRFIDEYFSLVAASTRFCHINFCHEKTTALRHPKLSNANAWEGNGMHVKRSDPHPHEGTQIVCSENTRKFGLSTELIM